MTSNSIRYISTTLLFLFLTACGVDGKITPNSAAKNSKQTDNSLDLDMPDFDSMDTYTPEKPIVIRKEDIKIVRGATKFKQKQVKWNASDRTFVVAGTISLSQKAGELTEIPVDLQAKINGLGQALVVADKTLLINGNEWQVSGKVLCLSLGKDNQFTCEKAVVDIFVKHDKSHFYQHQIEYTQSIKSSTNKDSDKKTDNKDNSSDKSNTVYTEGTDDAQTKTRVYEQTLSQQELEKLLKAKVEDKKSGSGSSGGVTDKSDKNDSKGDGKDATPSKSDDDKNNVDDDAAFDKKVASKMNEVLGAVNNGNLNQGIDMYKRQQALGDRAGFHIIRPERKTHFASTSMAVIIEGVGQWLKLWLPNFRLMIGDISAERGGRLGSHKSHQSGLDVDIAYFFKPSQEKYFIDAVAADGKLASRFVPEVNWQVFKAAVSSKRIDRIFVIKQVKSAMCKLAIARNEITKETRSGVSFETLRRLIPDTEHNSHFHLRIVCPANQTRCAQMKAPPMTTGCF